MIKKLMIAFVVCLMCNVSIAFAENVGLLIMATGKYVVFVEPLINSAKTHFCKNHQVTYYVFTDGYLPPAENVVCIYQPKLGWPRDTMMRYHAYLSHSDLFTSEDYLFACDADMLFVDTVGDEILGSLVATLSPGFTLGSPYPRSRGAYETNPLSTACVRDDEGELYFAGGFYGGTTQEVLKMLSTNVANINQDLDIGLIAAVHDESHWNRYCIDHPPTVILSPSYCYPENWQIPYTRRLLALDKNHDEMRK